MTGQIKGANGTVSLPSYTFASDLNTGIYRIGSDNFALVAGATKIVDISTTGIAITGSLTVSTAGWIDTSAIAEKAVTYAKIQDITASSRLLGRATSGAGVTEEITVGSGLNINGTTITAPAFPPAASYRNLVIKVATNTTVTVAAAQITTTDGTTYQTTELSGTINLGTNGAANALDAGTIAIDKWYFIFAIAKTDGTTAGLASLSSTAPTLPTGYTYFARIGAVQTIHASAILYGIWQFGRTASYVAGLAGGTPAGTATPGPIAVGNTGTYSITSPTLVATNVTGDGKYVPTTASRINLTGIGNFKGASSSSGVQFAPSQSYSGANNGPTGSNGLPWAFDNGASNNLPFGGWITLEATTISIGISGAGGAVNCLGWEDNI